MTVKVMIVDDHTIMREGLSLLIAAESGMEVCGQAADGHEALDLVRQLNPDVILMDLTMPGCNGIEAIKRILADCPRAKVLALSMHSDISFVDGALQAGASGYLLKDCAHEELVQAIRDVINGRPHFSPGVASKVTVAYVRYLDGKRVSVLSGREREVLQLIAEGKSVNQIAAVLNVSSKTVQTHRYQIMLKLRINSVAALTKYAIREGLTTLDF